MHISNLIATTQKHFRLVLTGFSYHIRYTLPFDHLQKLPTITTHCIIDARLQRSTAAAAATTTTSASTATMSLTVNLPAINDGADSVAAAVAKAIEAGHTLCTKVALSDDKELQVFDDGGVYIRSLTKQGKRIHLTLNSWAHLRSRIHEVDCEARELNRKTRPVKYRSHIGHAVYVSVTDGFRCVDLRRWYLPYGLEPGNERPTREGVSLNLQEWSALLDALPILEADSTVLATARPCTNDTDHMSQLGQLACPSCNPFRHMNWSTCFKEV